MPRLLPSLRNVYVLATAGLLIFGPDIAPGQHAVDVSAPGRPIEMALRGQNPHRGLNTRRMTLRIGQRTSLRGPAGGLDADTYDWRDIESGRDSGSPRVDTLRFMQEAAQRDSECVFTVNVRGLGRRENDNTWVCADPPGGVDELASLAADWVRYANQIVPQAQAGAPLSEAQQALVDQLKWTGPRVPPPTERPYPPILWWEIGNEPELDAIPEYIQGHRLAPEEYHRRYVAIVAAMKAVDPNIRVGPQIIFASSGHLGPLLADANAPVDFISYHPYTSGLYDAFESKDAAKVTAALHEIRNWHGGQVRELRKRLTDAGRDPNTPLMASEWNDLHWRGQWSTAGKSMTHALGTAETLFALAMLDVRGAHFWDSPSAGPPSYMVFEQMQDYFGDALLYSDVSNAERRIYVTADRKNHVVAVWALNFTNEQSPEISIALRNADKVRGVRCFELCGTQGAPTLFSDAKKHEVAWHLCTPITREPADLRLKLAPASVTLIAVHLEPPRDRASGERWLDFGKQMIDQGQTELAEKYLQRVVDEFPDDDIAAEARRLLAELER